MRYRVLWSPSAEQRLEEILQDQTERTQIANAARWIDYFLARYPISFSRVALRFRAGRLRTSAGCSI
jgi:hypothetical protein